MSAIRSSLLLSLAVGLAMSAAVASEVIRMKGSDTIGGELAPDLGRAYEADHPGISVITEALGSGTAFVGLLDGSADVGNASRPVKPAELAEVASRGLTLSEFVVGYDGVAVIVHPDNPVPSLTVDELSRIFTGAVASWRDVGGPQLPIRLLSRPSYSGTHGFFKDKVVRRGNAKGPEEFAATTQWVEDNVDLLREVAEDPAAVSYVGLGWLDPTVRAMPVAPVAGEAPVVASLTTVRRGAYPLYRPLLMYTVGTPEGATRDFLRFVLSDQGRAIVARHGFVPSDVAVELADVAPAAARRRPEPETVRITFPFGRTTLDAAAEATLREVARRIMSEDLRCLVSGHSDAVGSANANRVVARARAEAVAARIRELGVPGDRLSIQGHASDEPVASNETAAGRAANRRVDVVLIPAAS